MFNFVSWSTPLPEYVPNPDPSRLDLSTFGQNIETMFSWIRSFFLWFVQLLDNIPVTASGVSYLDLLIYFMILFCVLHFFVFGQFSAGWSSGGFLSSRKDFN